MWHRLFPRFCGRFYFRRISVRGAERIPASGPVLWLGLHRNGAVDGFAYAAGLRRPLVFLISAQLRKNLLARVFFGGITVARTAAEGDRSANRAALDRSLDLLRAGGELFVFPEGTSTLGPRHLPFKAGAAQLALDWQERGGGQLAVVPVGIHYDCAWGFRSDVEIVVGAPVDVARPAEATPLAHLKEMRRRITTGLESVGVNFADDATQHEAEAIATFATQRVGGSRWRVLQACERGVPANVSTAWRALDAAAMARGAARYRGVPLLAVYGETPATRLLLAPVVLAGLALNLPPWLGAAWAGRRLPDDRNVISFWKIMVGMPALALWAAVVSLGCIVARAWAALGLYALLSGIAWLGYDPVKRSAVAAWNRLRHGRALDEPTQVLVRAIAASFPA